LPSTVELLLEVKTLLSRRWQFCLLIFLFSLKIVTIAVALFVEIKSQLSAIGPDAVKASSSV
jgi:hypothetical protein